MFEELERKTLNRAIESGIVDVVLRPFSGASIPHSLFALVRDPKWRQTRQNPEQFELSPSSQSLRWQESYRMVTQPRTDYYAAEVARFAVPKGEVGFVQHLEQVVNDIAGNYYPTNQEYWGSPEFGLSDVDNIRWVLKLDYYNGTLPPWYAAVNTVPIPYSSMPGYPFTDLSEVRALWYPAHCNRRLRLIVPGNRVLRLIVYTPPTTTYTWRLGGRLAGYTQATFQTSALANARMITC